MNWLNNSWVVGIGGGILSGLVVTWISRYLLGKRENREYLQKVLGANRELIYTIRPGISEGVIPSQEVVVALINSTARKYSVSPGDLYGPPEIAEELTKEVMDSSFISSAKKAEHCSQLASLVQKVPSLIHEEPEPAKAAEKEQAASQTLSEYRRRTTTMISMMAGILAATMTFMVSFMGISKNVIRGPFEIVFPTVATLLTIVVTMYAYLIFRQSQKRRRGQDQKDDASTKEDKGKD